MARWGKVEFKELERLEKRLTKFCQVDIDNLCRDITNRLTALMIRKVRMKTPVGIYPSVVSFTTKDGVDVTFNVTPKMGGTLRRNWKAGETLKNGFSYENEVFNPTEYAIYVEYGHRTRNHAGWVDGKFMMTLSIDEVERQRDRLISKMVMDKLKEVFGG